MRRALGKGLNQLIGEQLEGTGSEVSVDAIIPNERQPRSVFDDARLKELAASVREYGILQPLVVRPLTEGRFELIAGERRLRAAKLAGLATVPITIRAAGNQTSLELALIENIQREDIGPMECARAYRKLMDEFTMTQEQVADKVGKARTSIANTIRLLRLPAPIQQGLESGSIQEGHARALLAFDTADRQIEMFERIVDKGLSVREVEKAARTGPVRTRETKPVESKPATDWSPLEEALSITLGSKVKIQSGEVGGKITVEFYSDEDLDRILGVLGISL